MSGGLAHRAQVDTDIYITYLIRYCTSTAAVAASHSEMNGCAVAAAPPPWYENRGKSKAGA